MFSCHFDHMIEAFTVSLLKVIFHRESFRAFLCDEAPVEGLWEAAVLCHAPTIHRYNHTVIQMEWEICLSTSKPCRWEEEMTMDLFPLGHTGVALDGMETNRRRAHRGSLLESKVRMPTMEDMITVLSCAVALWMIKNIFREIRHCHAQVHSVGGVLFRLLLPWTHR